MPYMKRAVWIAITRTNDANDLGIEWNEAGPCSEGSMAQDCGTSKLASRGQYKIAPPRRHFCQLHDH